MILTSPSKDVDQDPPVTTTFDGPRRPRPGRIDWDRVERLHSFVRERALERLDEANRRHDLDSAAVERQSVLAIDAIFTQARRRRGMVAACAITFFRARAMRDAQHPEFLGEWLGSAGSNSRSA